jgi:peptidoglycan/xylan/chitin deacetylase (PgdA/CDA1 family)
MSRLNHSPWNWIGFCVATIAVWAAYFAWRPPMPMLFMKHEEHLGTGSQEIALTLDDSPHPLTTPLLLASLKHANVKATFFCVGEGLRIYPELAYRMVAEGHHLANHSQPHHNLTTVVPETYAQHVDACFDQIEKVGQDAGIPHQTTLFRPPGGGMSRDVMAYLYKRGYTLAWWSNNVGDWTCPPAWKIADGVKANMKPGDILLLHDGGTGTPQAIPAIVKEARARGLNFILMPEGK